MAWDNNAVNLTAKVIMQVESGLVYDAINYRDPITVGAFQWYGTRAASILNRMRNENSSSWTGVASSLNNDLLSHASTSSWWTSRYLTRDEGNSIKPVLRNNVAIQHNQAIQDFNGYKDAYTRQGGDANGNTQAAIFFCVMYHQTPSRALNILRSAGVNSTIDRLYSFAMNDSTFSKYRSRYTSARDLIKSGNADGVNLFGSATTVPGDDTVVDGDDPLPDNTGPTITSEVQYITKRGNNLYLHMSGGKVQTAYPERSNHWVLNAKNVEGAPVDNTTVPIPEGNTPVSGDTPGSKALAWAMQYKEQWKYGNGAGRLNPFVSGYSDCSGVTYLAYLKACGINIGTYTTPQSTFGTLITKSKTDIRNGVGLLPGDLIFFASSRTIATRPYGHVELWVGDGTILGLAPSTAPGPRIKPISYHLDSSTGDRGAMARRPW